MYVLVRIAGRIEVRPAGGEEGGGGDIAVATCPVGGSGRERVGVETTACSERLGVCARALQELSDHPSSISSPNHSRRGPSYITPPGLGPPSSFTIIPPFFPLLFSLCSSCCSPSSQAGAYCFIKRDPGSFRFLRAHKALHSLLLSTRPRIIFLNFQ